MASGYEGSEKEAGPGEPVGDYSARSSGPGLGHTLPWSQKLQPLLCDLMKMVQSL